MATETLEKARTLLQERKRELSDELQQVEGALAQLKGGQRRPARRRSGSRQRRSANGRRGGRRDQFLAAVKENPGARVSEIAKAMGVSSQQAHGIARRLREQGEIQRQGKGYALRS